MFIMSLAVSDLIVGLCVMPISSAYAISGEWKFGLFLCQFWLNVDYTASTASILNLLILSFDRYWSIKSPLKYLRRRTKKRATIMLAIVWFSSALWIVPIQFWHYWYTGGIRKIPENVCETEFADNFAMKFCTSLLNFYFPMLLLIVVYCRIYMEIKKRSSIELGVCAKDYPINRINSDSPSDDHHPTKNYNRRKVCNVENYNNLTLICLPNSETELEHSDDYIFDEVNVRVEVENQDVSESESLSKIRNGLRGHRCNARVRHCLQFVRRAFNDVSCGRRKRERIELRRHTSVQSKRQHRRPEQKNKKKQQTQLPRSLQSEKKAARQLGVILSAFILCWLPYSIFFLIIAYCFDCIDPRVHTASIWLGYMNSTMNPIIYPLCNTKFKRAFKRILYLERGQESSASVNTTHIYNIRCKNMD
ncbi:HRH1 (predicted) [Pycnogonum litorale]